MKNNALLTMAAFAAFLLIWFPFRASALPAPPKTGDLEAWSDWLETAMPDDDLENNADSIGLVEKTLKQMKEVLAAMESGNAPEMLIGSIRKSCDLLAENLEEMRKNPPGDDDGEDSEEEDPDEGEPEIEGPFTGVPVVPLPALPRDFQNSLDLTVQLPPHEHGPDLDDLRSRIDTYLEGGGVVTSVPIPGVDDSADNETNDGISVGGDSDDTVHVDEKNRGGGVPSGSGGGIVLSSVSPETASSSRESSPPTSSRIGRKSGTLSSSHGASAPSTWGAIRGEGTSKPMAGISPFGEDNVDEGN